ncbi:MAG: hypothetical protein U9Q34_01260, partial [Elusimicrobiota bacterium]|nr:hypothetical protein [Elusimicrobiota bacterium]
CSAVSDDCGPSKEELKILQTKKFNESKVALKKQEPIIVKAPLKTKKKEIAANKEKMNIKSNLNSEKKEKADYSKIAAAMAIIMSFGFTLNYFHRKRRKK